MVLCGPIDPITDGQCIAYAEIAAAASGEGGDEKASCFHWALLMRERVARKGRNLRGAHAPARVAERALAVCWLEISCASLR